MSRRRELELEFDLPRMLLLAALLAALLGGAFWLGRRTAPRVEARAAPMESRPSAAAEEATLAEESVFDSAGGPGAPREPGRQVTGEPSRGGSFELDIGRAASRAEAERLRARAGGVKVPTLLVREEDGAYRVIGGPYSTRAEAERASKRAGADLGRPVPIRQRAR